VDRRGWPPAVEYVDVGASRPQLAALMDGAQHEEFEMVLVWRLDRWGRNLAHCLAILHWLSVRGIDWCALDQGIHTADINGRLLDALMAFGTQAKSERIKAGMRKAVKRTFVASGRPKKVFDREWIHALHAEGKSIRAIAAELRVSYGTVRQVLGEH
jgi:DNA invertase Pin-like site-specific DNA recombinase